MNDVRLRIPDQIIDKRTVDCMSEVKEVDIVLEEIRGNSMRTEVSDQLEKIGSNSKIALDILSRP